MQRVSKSTSNTRCFDFACTYDMYILNPYLVHAQESINSIEDCHVTYHSMKHNFDSFDFIEGK